MKHKSVKARAWWLAALWAQQCEVGDMDVEPGVRAHLLASVVPSLKRTAERIERNRAERSNP